MSKDIQYISQNLITYLRAAYQAPDMSYKQPIERLQGGFETTSYQVSLVNQPQILPESLVLRLYPERYGPNPASWEAAVQNSLFTQGYPVAQVHQVCTELSVLGGAFMLMDLVPGVPLGFADPDLVASMLGSLHADLHMRNPVELKRALGTHGIDPGRCIKDHSIGNLQDIKSNMPWMTEIFDWLEDHPPLVPNQLVGCHGDFHPLNIMMDSGQVTGVLDWGSFAFADPNYDIGNTLILITIPYKYLATQLEGFPIYDSDEMVHTYMTAYQRRKPIDLTTLDYYLVRRCVLALIHGAEGQKVWQHPPIVTDLLTRVREKTGIEVKPPHD